MSKRIRVLHLISGFAVEGVPGGVTRYVVELARTLQGGEIEPLIGGLWDYGTPYEAPRRAALNGWGIPTLTAAQWDEKEAYQSCMRAWRGFPVAQVGPVEIVHSHGEFSDLLALLLRRRLGARALVRTIHNEIEWSKRPLYGQLFPNALYPFFFAAELAVSRRVAENADRRPLSRIRGRQAQVMPNALNFARFDGRTVDRRAKLISLGLSPTARVIGTVGRLVPQKAVDLLIETLPALLTEYPQIVCLIVGDGPLRDALEAQAQNLGVAHAVHFTGPRDDVEELLGVMDVFVSSSRWEGLPTVILESMAARVPVAATRVSGTIELIQDGETGLLVPPGDAAALAQAIRRLLADPPMAQRLALQAEDRVRSHFSMDTVARQHERLYRQLARPEN